MAQLHKDGDRVRIGGALTMLTVPALLKEGIAGFTGGTLEVDLAEVEEVDSAALSLLLEWLRQAEARNAGLAFVNLPANLISLATLYGVLDLIPQHTH